MGEAVQSRRLMEKELKLMPAKTKVVKMKTFSESQISRRFAPYNVTRRHFFEGQVSSVSDFSLQPNSAKTNYLRQLEIESLKDLIYFPSKRVLAPGEMCHLQFDKVSGDLGLIVQVYSKFILQKLSLKSPFLTDSVLMEKKRSCNFIVSVLSLLKPTSGPFQVQHLWHFLKLQQNENLCHVINYTRSTFPRAMDRAYTFGDFLLSCIPNDQNIVQILSEMKIKFSVQEKDVIYRIGELIPERLAVLIRVSFSNWVTYFDRSNEYSFVFYYQVDSFDPDLDFVFRGPKKDPVFDEAITALSQFLDSPISGIIKDDSGMIRNLVFVYIKNIIYSLKPIPRRKNLFKTEYYNNFPKFFSSRKEFIDQIWGNINFLYFSLSKFLDFLAYIKFSANIPLDYVSLCKKIQVKLAEQTFDSDRHYFISDFYNWPK